MTRQRRLAVAWVVAAGGLAIACSGWIVPGVDTQLRGQLLVVGSFVEVVGIIMISMARRKPEGR